MAQTVIVAMERDMAAGIVGVTSLNVRQTPDPSGAVVTVLIKGASVDEITTDDSNEWLLVSADVDNETQIGWVQSQYIVSPGKTNPNWPGVYFTALVQGGYFSSDPDTFIKGNADTLRSIRTNNPGAINDLSWQHSRPGYVGKTGPDSQGNKTSIYCAPEYGVASWYTLLADRYKFSQSGVFSVSQLARAYAGGDAKQAAIDSYIDDWCRLATTSLKPDSTIHLLDDDEMLSIAHGVFRHEASGILRINDDQILFGIKNQRTGTLPPAPKPL